MLRLGKRRMAGAVKKFVIAPFFRARKPNADADRQRGRATDERGSTILRLARVSRRHATLQRQSGRWRVEDLGSTNGITVNGKPCNSATVRSGDVISLGGLEIRFEA